MKKVKVLLITENFPYDPGEQFLEDEVKYWAEVSDVELTIAPLKARGAPREIPVSLRVDTSLARYRRTPVHYFRGLLSRLLWCECLGLIYRRRLSLAALKEAGKTSVRVQHVFAALMSQGNFYDIIYCYWNDAGAYAAAMAKRRAKCAVLVSRAHGFDLYEFRRSGGNLPFKRQLIGEFDFLFVISDQARNYFLSTFGEGPVAVSRLGVPVGKELSSPSPDSVLRVLSVSFCVPVKRIELIMDGVVEFAHTHPEIRVEWVHLGDGPLRASLMQRARESVIGISNLQISFLGEQPNWAVRRRMADEPWDVLVNASEAEGVPVSIMEAMSFGIPAIAPNVGGVGEIVDAESGLLIDPDSSAQVIANALSISLPKFKCLEFRRRCKSKIGEKYNAEVNYQTFVRNCIATID